MCYIEAMGKPRIVDRYNFLTTTQVCEALGLSIWELRKRLQQEILPAPTKVAEGGVCLFDQNWLRLARAIIANSFEGKARKKAHV